MREKPGGAGMQTSRGSERMTPERGGGDDLAVRKRDAFKNVTASRKL